MKKLYLLLLLVVIGCTTPPSPDETPLAVNQLLAVAQTEPTSTCQTFTLEQVGSDLIFRCNESPGVTPTVVLTEQVGSDLIFRCNESPGVTPTVVLTDTPTSTVVVPTETPSPTATNTPHPPGHTDPYIEAPSCEEIGIAHSPTTFHGLWSYEYGCHYDHTHAMVYPEWANDLFGDYTQYTGGQTISYPYQTFSAHGSEVDFKPNGYKRFGMDIREYPCTPNLNNKYSIDAYFTETHNLATAVEYTGRVHSFFGMAHLCDPANPEYEGLVIAGGHQDYGQAVSPYQGLIIPRTNAPLPSYPSPKPPYFTLDCIGASPCKARLLNAINSTWDSQNSSGGGSGIVNHFFQIGFRQRDIYGYFLRDELDLPDPTFVLACQDASGNYQPEGCIYNGSTFQVYKIVITIKKEWDGLAGFDEDGQVNGFVTHHGYGDLQGNPNPECHEYNESCTPLILENVPTQEASVNLFSVDPERFQAFSSIPDFDICFDAAGDVVDCSTDGAIPSGWIGESN